MSIVQTVMGTAEGAMAVYIGMGVVILMAGWMADKFIVGGSSAR